MANEHGNSQLLCYWLYLWTYYRIPYLLWSISSQQEGFIFTPNMHQTIPNFSLTIAEHWKLIRKWFCGPEIAPDSVSVECKMNTKTHVRFRRHVSAIFWTDVVTEHWGEWVGLSHPLRSATKTYIFTRIRQEKGRQLQLQPASNVWRMLTFRRLTFYVKSRTLCQTKALDHTQDQLYHVNSPTGEAKPILVFRPPPPVWERTFLCSSTLGWCLVRDFTVRGKYNVAGWCETRDW